jgi:hypothetical protein
MKTSSSLADWRLTCTSLMLVALLCATAKPQTAVGSYELRPAVRIALFNLPEMSNISPTPQGNYEDPGLTLASGLSLAYWVSQQVNLSLGVDYSRLKIKYHLSPIEVPEAASSWDLTFVPIVLSCEYSLPFRVGSVSPFVGLGAGLALCSMKFESNYAESAFLIHAFTFSGSDRSPLTIRARMGLSVRVSENLGGLFAVEYWRTADIHPMTVRGPDYQPVAIGMYLSGIALSLSAQL